uniref:Uncharacterized protein n=1 Tax=Chlamydomonas euryale TaxID=1486919 RepID=A0A7R9VNV2_9CHLO
MAIYAPRRQLVEVWLPAAGVRLLALSSVGTHCQLLQASDGGCGTAGCGVCGCDETHASASELASGHARAMLVDGGRGTITDLESCLAWSVGLAPRGGWAS